MIDGNIIIYKMPTMATPIYLIAIVKKLLKYKKTF